MALVRSGNLQSLIGLMFVIIIGLIAVLYIWKYRSFFTGTKTTTKRPIVAAAPAGGIYDDASPPHACDNVTDGQFEPDNERREPQIACGFDFLNTEATVYINTHGVNDTLSVKLRGPKHSSPTPDPDMCNNIHYINLGSPGTPRGAFGKQSGHTDEYCDWGDQIQAPDDTWIGVKAVEYNEGAGVRMLTYLDNPEGSGWKLVANTLDDGAGTTGCGSQDPKAADPYTVSPCQGVPYPVSIGFRIDGISPGTNDVQFKGLSVREIAVPTQIIEAAPSTGGGTTVFDPGDQESTPTETETEEPAEEEEDTEEEDTEDTEDTEDNEEPQGTGPGTRSQDPTTRRINQCAGLTGETYRSCVNGAGARSTRRRANTAKAYMRNRLAAYTASQYRPVYIKSSTRRARVGNLI